MKSPNLMLLLITLLYSQMGFAQSHSEAVNPIALEKFLTTCVETKADRVLLFHQNESIAYLENPDCDSVYMNTASMVKSWAALVIGKLIEAGTIESVDDPVCKYMIDWRAGCTENITIRQLMDMSSGLLKRPVRESVLAQSDMNAFVVELPLDTLPGSKWSYSNESVQLLAVLMEKASGKPVAELYEELLFTPLGMDSTSLYHDPAGNGIIFGGCRTTVQDVAQIGLLMANKGQLAGERYLPTTWIEEITQSSERNEFYGLLWWLDPQNENYAAMGDYGQMIIVFPESELVFIRQQSCANNDPAQNMRWMGPTFLEQLRSVIISE